MDKIKEKFLEIQDKRHPEFYVLYLDPAGIVKKLFLAQYTEIINFMKEHINYAHCEGMTTTSVS